MRTRTIRQSVRFNASPRDMFEIMLDSEKHARYTGMGASIDRRVGGSFTAGGDYISGENLELVEGRRIVQRWRGSDWPEGHYSKVTFEFHGSEGGTELVMTQEGVPEAEYEMVDQGWREYYWDPIKRMLEGEDTASE